MPALSKRAGSMQFCSCQSTICLLFHTGFSSNLVVTDRRTYSLLPITSVMFPVTIVILTGLVQRDKEHPQIINCGEVDKFGCFSPKHHLNSPSPSPLIEDQSKVRCLFCKKIQASMRGGVMSKREGLNKRWEGGFILER